MKLIASVKKHVFYPAYDIFYVLSVYWAFSSDVRDVFLVFSLCNCFYQIVASFYVPCSSSILSEPRGKYFITPLICCFTSSPQVMHLY